nr:hypothetical protein 15 [Candidatus Omnitrophota bacterium]
MSYVTTNTFFVVWFVLTFVLNIGLAKIIDPSKREIDVTYPSFILMAIAAAAISYVVSAIQKRHSDKQEKEEVRKEPFTLLVEEGKIHKGGTNQPPSSPPPPPPSGQRPGKSYDEVVNALEKVKREKETLENAIEWVTRDMSYKAPEQAISSMQAYHSRLTSALEQARKT